MKIVVCLKVMSGELSPFDEAALEEALRIPDAEVILLSMCPASAQEKLCSLTRLGVARAILISDVAYAGSDTLATAYILAEQIRRLSPDLILCGRQSTDGDTAQVGPMLATQLGYSLLTHVLEIHTLQPRLTARTRMGEEVAELPALLTMERTATLRFPSLRSRPGEVEVVTQRELGLPQERCGLAGSPTRVVASFENTAGERKCRFIAPTELEAALGERSAAQTDCEGGEDTTLSDEPLPLVWAVGRAVAPAAHRIGKRVEVLPVADAQDIVARAKVEQPDAILWDADLWGRRNAPVAAALLQTGLCADCTRLDVENGHLMMYRPAKGGNIMAKIRCLTQPQMATVRTAVRSDAVMVSGGRGVADHVDSLRAFAESMGAELTASRTLVDANLMPYESQIGLTGRTVSPKVYIAVGISGAVQHTCAISRADTVVAINPDRDAPIFRYADIGICCSWQEFLKQRGESL